MGTLRPRALTNRTLMYLVIAAGTLLVVGANAHFLYAALESQPDCVAHLKVGHGQAGAFGAADSAC
ncbi:MAG: hypothetical protein EON59_07600 [Alphaproteobacteria bacterium]|nr:MAG: hypothetical protein EON59_07600 [Alphaproteobacteria bacterium]